MLRFVAAFGSEVAPEISFPAIAQGQDKKLEFTASRIPLGDSVVSLLLVGKLAETDADEDAVFSKLITATSRDNIGYLSNSGNNGVAAGFVTLSRSETFDFPIGVIPYITGWVRLRSGAVAPCVTGTMEVTDPIIVSAPGTGIVVDHITVTVPAITAYNTPVTATAVVEDAANNPLDVPLLWSTNADPSVAVIDADTGALRVFGDGVFDVICTVDNISGEAVVTVALSTTPATVTVTLASPTVTNSGGTDQATAVVRNAAGAILAVPVTWTIVDPTLAGVNSSGLVSGTLPGNTFVRATVGAIHGDAALTVLDATDPTIMVAQVHALGPFRFTRLHLYDHPNNAPIVADGTSTLGYRQAYRVDACAPTDPTRRLIPNPAFLGAGVNTPVSVDGLRSAKGWMTPNAALVTSAGHDEGTPAVTFFPGTALPNNVLNDGTAGMTIFTVGHLPTGANAWSTTDGVIDGGDDLKNALSTVLNGSSFVLSEAGPSPSYAFLSLHDRWNGNAYTQSGNKRVLVATAGRDCRGFSMKAPSTTSVGGTRDIFWIDSTGGAGNFNDANSVLQGLGQGSMNAAQRKFFLDWIEARWPTLNVWNDTRRMLYVFGDSYNAPMTQSLSALYTAGSGPGFLGGSAPIMANVGAVNYAMAGASPSAQFPYSRLLVETADHSKRPAAVYLVGEFRNLDPLDSKTTVQLDAMVKQQFDWTDLIRSLTPTVSAGKVKSAIIMWSAGDQNSLPGGAAAVYLATQMNAGFAAHADGFVNINVFTPLYTTWAFGSGNDAGSPPPHWWGSTHPGTILQFFAAMAYRAAARKALGEYSATDNVFFNMSTDNVVLTSGAPTANPTIVDGRNVVNTVVSQTGKTYKHYLEHYVAGGDVREATSGTYVTVNQATGLLTRVAGGSVAAGEQIYRVTVCDQDGGIGMVEVQTT